VLFRPERGRPLFELTKRYAVAVVSVSGHGATPVGLVEHTIEICQLAATERGEQPREWVLSGY